MTEGNPRPGSTLPPDLRGAGPELAELLARNTHDGVAIVDGAKVVWSNSAAAAISGWSATDADKLGSVARIPAGLSEIRDGKWVQVRHFPLVVGARNYTVVLFTDSTAQARLRDSRDQLRALGLIDAATNLAGRHLALVNLERAIALAKRDKRSVGLLSLKLDRVRTSDPAQRAVTEEVTNQLGKRLTAFVRTSDTPARLAEDSFLVILTAMTSPDDGTIVAVRLLLALAQPFDVAGSGRTVQCSIGVAEAPRDAGEALPLLEVALAAADRAQHLGGGRYCTAADSKTVE